MSSASMHPFRFKTEQLQQLQQQQQEQENRRRCSEISVRELGGFSFDSNHEFVNDRSQLKVFYPPPPPPPAAAAASQRVRRPLNDVDVDWDLHRGQETFVCKEEGKEEFLDNLLKWIQLHGMPVDGSGVPGVDIVCWRGLMTHILCTPYENSPRYNDGWKIVVCRFNDVLYCNELDPPNARRNSRTADNRQVCYRGFKFETYLTAAGANSVPDTDAPVNNKQAFNAVVTTRLGSHSIMMSAEVDCCEANDSHEYIELKTTVFSGDNRQKRLRWWAQSAIVNVPTIVVGFRERYELHIVRKLQEYSTADLPKGFWSTDECYNFADDFLQYVKDTVQHDYRRAIYVFCYNPSVNPKEVTCDRVAARDASASSFMFLPSWYTGDATYSRAAT